MPGCKKDNDCKTTSTCTGKNCSDCSNPDLCQTSLVYSGIYDDIWNNANDAILNQFAWQEFFVAADKVLELEKEFSIPLTTVVTGTEPDPSAPIYGYNTDGSLDLTGGKAKSYNSCYTEMDVRYHEALERIFPSSPTTLTTQIISFFTPRVAKTYCERIVSYFTNRGYDMPAPDQFKQFSNQYIWQYPEGQNQFFNLSRGYVAMRVIWDNKKNCPCNKHKECQKDSKKKCVPRYIDLHATSARNYFVLDTYEPDLSKRKNGHAYPLRIPVTTDFCGKFQQLYNVSPIAYYDCKCHVLTIHVPDNGQNHLLVHSVFNSGFQPLDFEFTDSLVAFDGSFSIFQKDPVRGIIPSGFKKMSLFAQTSEVVYIKTHTEGYGRPPTDTETRWPIRARGFSVPPPTVGFFLYTGIVAPLMSGSTPSFDLFAVPFPIVNSYTSSLDPIQYPVIDYCGVNYEEGDNPVTTVKEQYSTTSTITAFDNTSWAQIIFKLPNSVITAQTSFPENVSTTVVPAITTSEEAYTQVIMHEFVHTTQYASGMGTYVPVEGMAVGVEMDVKSTGNIFATYRSRQFTFAHLNLTRGSSLMIPTGQLTYGFGMFWHYTQAQFDPNMQLQRRTMDILTGETLGPSMKANNIPDSYQLPLLNTTGPWIAVRNSLQELFSRDVKDLLNNFYIAMALLRNNSAIPAEYRVNFPYWIYNTEYQGYPQIQAALSVVGIQQFADWWEKMNENQIVPANYGTAIATGQTFINTLPANFSASLRVMRGFSFNVPREINTITITITSGEWKLTLFQFTSDGTPVGSWIQDGPHTIFGAGVHIFNVSTHVPAFSTTGNIRLVCTHVTLNGNGDSLADYFTPENPSGNISIVSV